MNYFYDMAGSFHQEIYLSEVKRNVRVVSQKITEWSSLYTGNDLLVLELLSHWYIRFTHTISCYHQWPAFIVFKNTLVHLPHNSENGVHFLPFHLIFLFSCPLWVSSHIDIRLRHVLAFLNCLYCDYSSVSLPCAPNPMG